MAFLGLLPMTTHLQPHIRPFTKDLVNTHYIQGFGALQRRGMGSHHTVHTPGVYSLAKETDNPPLQSFTALKRATERGSMVLWRGQGSRGRNPPGAEGGQGGLP